MCLIRALLHAAKLCQRSCNPFSRILQHEHRFRARSAERVLDLSASARCQAVLAKMQSSPTDHAAQASLGHAKRPEMSRAKRRWPPACLSPLYRAYRLTATMSRSGYDHRTSTRARDAFLSYRLVSPHTCTRRAQATHAGHSAGAAAASSARSTPHTAAPTALRTILTTGRQAHKIGTPAATNASRQARLTQATTPNEGLTHSRTAPRRAQA